MDQNNEHIKKIKDEIESINRNIELLFGLRQEEKALVRKNYELSEKVFFQNKSLLDRLFKKTVLSIRAIIIILTILGTSSFFIFLYLLLTR